MLLRRGATTEPVTNFGYPAKYTITKWVAPTATARGRRTERERKREREKVQETFEKQSDEKGRNIHRGTIIARLPRKRKRDRTKYGECEKEKSTLHSGTGALIVGDFVRQCSEGQGS